MNQKQRNIEVCKSLQPIDLFKARKLSYVFDYEVDADIDTTWRHIDMGNASDWFWTNYYDYEDVYSEVKTQMGIKGIPIQVRWIFRPLVKLNGLICLAEVDHLILGKKCANLIEQKLLGIPRSFQKAFHGSRWRDKTQMLQPSFMYPYNEEAWTRICSVFKGKRSNNDFSPDLVQKFAVRSFLKCVMKEVFKVDNKNFKEYEILFLASGSVVVYNVYKMWLSLNEQGETNGKS